MCDNKKAQKMIEDIELALFGINQKFGISKDFGYRFIFDKKTGDVKRIQLTIPAYKDIDSKFPMDYKWHPKKIERKLLPVLNSLASA